MDTPESTPHAFTLQAIYIRDSQIRLVNGFDPMVPNQSLNGQLRCTPKESYCRIVPSSVEPGASTTLCAFKTEFEFQYLTPHSDNRPIEHADTDKNLAAQIRAEMVAEYIVSGTDFPSGERVASWAVNNVVLHCWPYWREYCQSSMQRMGLPVTMVPLFHFNRAAAPPEKLVDAASVSSRRSKTKISGATATQSKRR
jgi:hypothetical protein